MKRGAKAVMWCVTGGVLAGPLVGAYARDNPQNPYEGIVARNVFALRPPAPPPTAASVAPPPPKITLTGITTILGKKEALMLVDVPAVPVPGHPPQPAHQDSYILSEGERDGDIEVLAIDTAAATVKVSNHGTVQTLDFADNGVKLPSAASLPMAPGQPGFPRPPFGAPMRQIPTRPMRMFSPPGTPQASTYPGAPNTAPGMAPAFGGGVAVNQQQQQNQLTPDEQAVLIEAQRAKYEEENNPIARILPPTEFTPSGTPGMPQPTSPQTPGVPPAPQ